MRITPNVEDIDKNLFKELCFDFNEMVIDMILEGGEFNMGNNLSTISILRMDRDPQRKVIDWIESNKDKSELVKNKINCMMLLQVKELNGTYIIQMNTTVNTIIKVDAK